MSRFAALDLTTLPAPSAVVALDYDAILEARLVELEALLTERFDAAKVSELMGWARNIAASPMRYLAEAGAARELYMGNRINAAIRSVFLSSATGDDLDQIGANRGVVRNVVDDTDPDNPVLEGDVDFRARIQLVIESYSPHGTEGSYVYWALDADARVVDVVAYGPNHDVVPAVDPANALIVILSRDGDGTAAQDLLDAVYQNLIPDKRRPVADKVTVQSAVPIDYSIDVELQVTTPEAAAMVQSIAQANATEFAQNRLRIGRTIYRTSLAAALKVEGVVDVIVTEPSVDVIVGAFEASNCTAINISVVSITGGWRDG